MKWGVIDVHPAFAEKQKAVTERLSSARSRDSQLGCADDCLQRSTCLVLSLVGHVLGATSLR